VQSFLPGSFCAGAGNEILWGFFPLPLGCTAYPVLLFPANPKGISDVYIFLTKIYNFPNSGNLSGLSDSNQNQIRIGL
jgi:hypothetical protein